MDYSNIKFNGTFRNYQQKVLDKIITHIADGKVNIVAAPGSGKTILGLELIRYLNEPALIFSPSITIRQQWGERFKENFLQDKNDFDNLFSYSFQNIRLITSVTYQSLYAAYNKLKDEEKEDDAEEEKDTDDENDHADYSAFDLIQEVKKHHIRTICLDEAHHLRAEWQHALEDFISVLGDEIKIVSLTATPPYDSTQGEWKKYSALCGEIDEEIFIPELVGQKNLCPHQDFILFSYPSEKENRQLKTHRQKILECIDFICQQDYFKKIISDINRWYREDEYSLLEKHKEISCLLSLGRYYNLHIDDELIKLVCPTDELPKLDFSCAETAFQFISSELSYFFETSKKVFNVIKQKGLINHKKVDFSLPEKLENSLASSVGKFESIREIIISEKENLGNDLRMVILTDYIKKELVNDIGTDEPLKALGTSSIFEYIRRMNVEEDIAILSGSLIVVNKKIIPLIMEEASSKGISIDVRKLKNTSDYVEIFFSGKNKEKVNIITRIFESGYIKIIVGTKSLLGEGWDSPCINSLILASFVKSFMLSNQMRGRAIRIDKKKEEKCSNIFHLATIEDDYVFDDERINSLNKFIFNDKKEIISSDFEVLKRRFDCFLAPSYSSDVIEDGIERIDIIIPPFDKEGIKNINERMLEISRNRKKTRKKWMDLTSNIDTLKIVEEVDIPSPHRPKILLLLNIATIFLLLSALFAFMPLYNYLSAISVPVYITFLIALYVVSAFFLAKSVLIIIRFLTPKKSIRTLGKILLKSLKTARIVKTKEAKVITYKENKKVICGIINGTIYEKNVFTKSLVEMLSEIDNPRYVLVNKFGKMNNYHSSYACPSLLANNKDNVLILAKNLRSVGGSYDLVYTRAPGGRKAILKGRKFSYINKNGNSIKATKRVKNYLKYKDEI